MSKQQYISESAQIDNTTKQIDDSETLTRLLCSPWYYNELLGIVNPDAFDLRIQNSGDYEEYVSLVRPRCLQSQEDLESFLSNMGRRIWDNKPQDPNHYIGYGNFICSDAREVHEMIEIYPLIKGSDTHIGLFYRHPKGGYYCGPLPKTDPEILEMLTDLADLLEVTKIAPKANDILKKDLN